MSSKQELNGIRNSWHAKYQPVDMHGVLLQSPGMPATDCDESGF